jgi:undecaprenyl-diphosphatase
MESNDAVTAAILGVVQGATEFLPVSSSAHLIIVSWFMSGKPLPLALNVALHIGTASAVLIYFWRDWSNLTRDVLMRIFRRQRSFGADVLAPGLVLGSIPAAVIGLLWADLIEEKLHHPIMVIVPLALVGYLLWKVDKTAKSHRNLTDLRITDAILIGIAQASALFPGVSRSGATILCGRWLGLAREDAARFSFLLGAPAIVGAALLKYKEILNHLTDPVFLLGVASSALTGCLAISFLLKFLRRFGFMSFMIYRFLLAGILALIMFN